MIATDLSREWTVEGHRTNLERAAHKWPLEGLAGTLAEGLPPGTDIVVYHPWVGLALEALADPPSHWTDALQPLKPAEFKNLLQTIVTQTQEFERSLERLFEATHHNRQSRAKSAAYKRAMSAFEEHCPFWLPLMSDVDLDPFRKGAQAALEELRGAEISGAKAPRRAGLREFVFILGAVWQHASGKRPSAEKVESLTSSNPPFVRFIQALAELADLKPPTRFEVKTILNPSKGGED